MKALGKFKIFFVANIVGLLVTNAVAADSEIEGQTNGNYEINETLDFAEHQTEGLNRYETKILVPNGYSDLSDKSKLPVVVLLHGYSSTSWIQKVYLKLGTQLKSRNFVLALPEGHLEDKPSPKKPNRRNQFWNATGFCCDFRDEDEKVANPVDDVAYLTSVIEHITSNYKVDPKKVYLYGHSNGGMMAYRMACEKSEIVTAIATLGAGSLGPHENCKPTNPVSILHIHGTKDKVIPYEDGMYNEEDFYPGGVESIKAWKDLNSCGDSKELGRADYDIGLSGEETLKSAFQSCQSGDVESWAIEKGRHIPNINSEFSGDVLSWLFSR